MKEKTYSRYDRFLEEQKELLPLPSVQYHYMERRTARVSSDFHVRFDNAYYSVPKQFVHKQVLIRATTTRVRIYSLSGELLRDGERARYKGQWITDINHLPQNFREFSEWNSTYFIQRAMTVGPNTVETIRRILKSKLYEVQTYRQCKGVLEFAKKYNKKTLEECCRQAIEFNRTTYTFIKNSIPSIAAETITEADKRRINDQKNKGAYVMDADASDINHLLAKSRALVEEQQQGGERE